MELSKAERLRVSVMKRALSVLLRSPTTRDALAKNRGALAAQVEPEIAAMLRLDDLSGDSVLHGRTADQARRAMCINIAVADQPAPDDVSITPLTLETDAGPLPARLYHARGVPQGAPGIVFYHGGGFVTGDLDTHEGLCARMSQLARVRVISVDYRLAPEHPFPAAPEDCVAAFRAITKIAEAHGIDSKRLAVMGDSAGGNLSAVVALKTRGDAIQPALQVLVYPGTDMRRSLPSHAQLGVGWFLTTHMINWFYDHYSGKDEAVALNPDASPLLAPDVSGVCPALVYVAGLDPLRDEGLAYAARLSEAGVDVQTKDFKHLIHGFLLMTAASPGSAEAVVHIAKDVAQALTAR